MTVAPSVDTVHAGFNIQPMGSLVEKGVSTPIQYCHPITKQIQKIAKENGSATPKSTNHHGGV